MHKELTFVLDKNHVLNANRKVHHMVHGKIVAHLRTVAADAGQALHPQEEQEAVKRRRGALLSEQNWALMKKRERSKLKKRGGQTSKEIEATVDQDYLSLKPQETAADVPVKYLFDQFRVVITVSPPTRRRLDPPNLYPTVKALIDGLTDAALWEDDDFTHMKEMAFRYGAPTGVAGEFHLKMDIYELSEEEVASYASPA